MIFESQASWFHLQMHTTDSKVYFYMLINTVFAADLCNKVSDERDVSIQLLQAFADVADHRQDVSSTE